MKIKKLIAVLLLATMSLSLITACKKKNEDDTDIEEDTVSDDTQAQEEWMDIWDENEVYQGIANDQELDTNGTLADGTWFDSFKTVGHWNTSGNNINVEQANNQMHITIDNTASTQQVLREVTTKKGFEAEFKLRFEQFGQANGMALNFGGERVAIFISEQKLKLKSTSPTGDTYNIHANIGNDWHVYKFTVRDGIVSAYMDGAFLMSYTPETNSASVAFSFFGRSLSSSLPCKMQVEYASYKITENEELKIVSPYSRQVYGTANSDVEISVQAAGSVASSGKPIEIFLNGVYSGITNNGKMTFKSLCAGVYRVYAKSGDSVSQERIFTVSSVESSVAATRTLTTPQKLQSSYTLSFTVNGAGSVEAGDGLYKLSLNYTEADKGEYLAHVDGGIAYIYKNGRPTASYMLPYEKCGTTVNTVGNISDVKISAHNATLFSKDFSDNCNYNSDIGAIPFEYTLEFEYTKGAPAELRFNDGAYLLGIDINSDGIATGLAAPQYTAEWTTLFRASEGTSLYRVYVSSGIAQIFINNVWCKSIVLPSSASPRNLYVSGNGFGIVQIREAEDLFFMKANASDNDFDDYFTEDIKSPSETVQGHCLKTYARNTTISAKISRSSNVSGTFLLVARFDGRATGVFAGYDFDTNSFKIGSSVSSVSSIPSQITSPTLDEFTLSLTLKDGVAYLYCDGELVARETVSATGWGNVGYYSTLNGASLEAFSYEGDGSILSKTITTYTKGAHTVGIIELGGAVYICGEDSETLLKSTDGGKTFTYITRNNILSKSFFNTVVTKSGKVVSISRGGNDKDGYFYMASVSNDNGKTYTGPYRVNKDNSYAYNTMNCKLMQTSSGRLIFVSGETKEENSGYMTVYYSDSEGLTWRASKTEFSPISAGGLNLQEGCVVELNNGILRLYARCDAGFLYYVDSENNGTTWSLDWTASQFASPLSAFNAVKDPSTGAIYMAWEYNNTNDYGGIQAPRGRVALAVSYDNARTWAYVGDIDDTNILNNATWVHMNIGIAVTNEAVFVTVAKMIALDGEENATYHNYMVRIEKGSIIPFARFNAIHSTRNPLTVTNDSGAGLALGGVMIISSNGKHVYASGEYHDIDGVNGKRTMISAEIIASFMCGTLEYRGNSAVITVGNAEYVFTADSTQASIAGEIREMTFEAVSNKGTVHVSVEDLDNLLGLIAKKTDSGAIILTFEQASMNPGYLVANSGLI